MSSLTSYQWDWNYLIYFTTNIGTAKIPMKVKDCKVNLNWAGFKKKSEAYENFDFLNSIIKVWDRERMILEDSYIWDRENLTDLFHRRLR